MHSNQAIWRALRQAVGLITFRVDAHRRDLPLWLAIASGAAGGLLWGVIARIWMRLISSNPQLTIAGTAGILGIAALFGALVGATYTARRHGWQRWAQRMLRVATTVLFIPFGFAGGLPLMLTVLLITLTITQPALVCIWVLVVLALLATVADQVSGIMVVGILALALPITIWRYVNRRGHVTQQAILIDKWIERIVHMGMGALAIAGIGFVMREIMVDKPGMTGLMAIVVYPILLYPLIVALRIALEPSQAGAVAATHDGIMHV